MKTPQTKFTVFPRDDHRNRESETRLEIIHPPGAEWNDRKLLSWQGPVSYTHLDVYKRQHLPESRVEII